MRDFEWKYLLVGLLVVAGAVLLVLLLVHEYREYHRCVDNGGHFERRNCREVDDEICSTVDYGNGMVITSCVPTTTTVCDSVCIGANAEAR